MTAGTRRRTTVGRSVTLVAGPARLHVRSSAPLRRNPPPRSLRINRSDRHRHAESRQQKSQLTAFFRSLLLEKPTERVGAVGIDKPKVRNFGFQRMGIAVKSARNLQSH